MNTISFDQLMLSKPLLRALSDEGYEAPTAIQERAIPVVLAGDDLLATAQTGTGKTAAFSLPMLQMLTERAPRQDGSIRALILTPTRELALQIEESLRTYGRHLKIRTAVLLGGVSQEPQVAALRKRPDILVATPGRLLDLIGQGHVRLERVEILVLDEADRMLDMGFVRDVRRIVAALPRDRQTLFFSATLTGEIANLASDMLRNPTRVAVAPAASVADNIAQKVLFVEQAEKRKLLAELLRRQEFRRALVFTRTKHGADRLMKQLSREGITAEAIHSNKTQGARQRALAAFDGGSVKVLIGTDIVARGIDVEGITHVINYELPADPENYVHRIGRTARAGAAGTAISFCDASEVMMLRVIEKLTRSPIVTDEDHPFHAPQIAALRAPSAPSSGSGRAAAARAVARATAEVAQADGNPSSTFGRRNRSGALARPRL